MYIVHIFCTKKFEQDYFAGSSSYQDVANNWVFSLIGVCETAHQFIYIGGLYSKTELRVRCIKLCAFRI